MDSKDFAKNVKRIAFERNLTLLDISELTGLHVNSIQNWLRFKAVPNLGAVYKMAEGLGVSVHDLLEGQHVKQ